MNANDLFKAVMELDLEPIKTKLMHVESGEGWDLDKANAVEKEYRRFLCLMKLYPDEHIAPTFLVDTFWHYHILDTMKYAVDCENVFGYFQHHYPYVGLRGGDDEQVRIDSGERMRVLYEGLFGEPYPGASAMDGAATAFSAGPTRTSFCEGQSLATAFSAGPTRISFCKGKSLATAFSAGPTRISFCQGKSLATAFSAGPTRTPAHGARTEQSMVRAPAFGTGHIALSTAALAT